MPLRRGTRTPVLVSSRHFDISQAPEAARVPPGRSGTFQDESRNPGTRNTRSMPIWYPKSHKLFNHAISCLSNWTVSCVHSASTTAAVISAESILENRVSCIIIHEFSRVTYSKNESIHGVYRFFSTQPITKKAKMNRFTVLESQNRLCTTFHPLMSWRGSARFARNLSLRARWCHRYRIKTNIRFRRNVEVWMNWCTVIGHLVCFVSDIY